jgi:hypothetical protein
MLLIKFLLTNRQGILVRSHAAFKALPYSSRISHLTSSIAIILSLMINQHTEGYKYYDQIRSTLASFYRLPYTFFSLVVAALFISVLSCSISGSLISLWCKDFALLLLFLLLRNVVLISVLTPSVLWSTGRGLFTECLLFLLMTPVSLRCLLRVGLSKYPIRKGSLRAL